MQLYRKIHHPFHRISLKFNKIYIIYYLVLIWYTFFNKKTKIISSIYNFISMTNMALLMNNFTINSMSKIEK